MFHENNRQRLYKKMQGELVVLTAYDLLQQSGDMAGAFLQESSFWWLTGIEEAGWKLILDTARKQATLVRPARSKIDIIFNGESNDDAIHEVSGIREIIQAKDFEARLRQLQRHHPMVKTLTPKQTHEFALNPALGALHETLTRIFTSVQFCDKQIAELRAIKQPEEIQRLKTAIALTCTAFSDVRAKLASLKTEAEAEAEFVYAFHRVGATYAYEPVVASGENACTLHYVSGSAKLRARDLLLIDIGARVGGYSADVTRTYCVNPTKRQRAVHAAVEKAEQDIIALLVPGLPVIDYIEKSDTIMKKALGELGLINESSTNDEYRKYFPHAISHGLGIDTHDSLGAPRYFEPGMVVTVEPGIYIPEEGIGVRIEDDILITKTGHENLSAALPTSL